MTHYVEILGPSGVVVKRGGNLRAVLDHARKVGVQSVTLYGESDGGGLLVINYGDGNRTRTVFADYTVAAQWVLSRRSWDLTQTMDWGKGKQRAWSRHPGSSLLKKFEVNAK